VRENSASKFKRLDGGNKTYGSKEACTGGFAEAVYSTRSEKPAVRRKCTLNESGEEKAMQPAQKERQARNEGTQLATADEEARGGKVCKDSDTMSRYRDSGRGQG
jgi:hypothetical protein